MSLSARLLAPLYDRLVRPCEEACVSEWRSELVAPLTGNVLEIGAGTGANLRHYGTGVSRLILSEPDRFMRRRLERNPLAAEREIVDEIVDAPASALPFEDASFDAVVSTLVLCTVADPHRALTEAHRVLRGGGTLVFIEHVRAANNPKRLAWQRRIEPLWKRVFAGCHLTRDTEAAIARAGFEIDEIHRQSIRKAAPLVRPSIRGVARKPRR